MWGFFSGGLFYGPKRLKNPRPCILAAANIIELASIVMIAQICRFIIMQTNGLGTAVQQLGIHMVSYRRLQNVFQLPNEYDLSAPLDQLEIGQQKEVNDLRTIGYVLLWFFVPLALVVVVDLAVVKRKEEKRREQQKKACEVEKKKEIH